MERAKKEGFTQPASMLVKPIRMGERKAVLSTLHSISYDCDFVNSKFKKNGEKKQEFGNKLRDFFYIGERYTFNGNDEYDRKARKVIRMRRFKRILACAFIAFCATMVVIASGVIVQIFIRGGSV